MIVACATNNHKEYTEEHFGDALFFDIYDINQKEIKLIESLQNTVGDDQENHKDKALEILKLFKNHGVEATINKAFGANIKIIIKYVIPISINADTIQDSFKILQKYLINIEDQVKKNTKFYLKISEEKGLNIYEI